MRIHYDAGHPLAEPPTSGEIREIPVPVRIAEYVAAGCPLDAGAAACGIGRATVFAWVVVGEEWQDVELEEVPADRRAFRDFSRGRRSDGRALRRRRRVKGSAGRKRAETGRPPFLPHLPHPLATR
jgi:hypothetical protein